MGGLAFVYEKGDGVNKFTITERLALTEDDRLVPEEDPDARWLFATTGQEIALKDAVKYGLTDCASVVQVPVETKQEAPVRNERKRRLSRKRKST